MWNRFIRAIKSLFGGLVSQIEDPKLILEQNIREMNDQIPRMNENIATVKANVIMLKKEVEKLHREQTELISKIKSAINAERDDIAENYAVQLEKNKSGLEKTSEQLQFAEKAYEKALQVKKAFMREKDKKIRDAREALKASERAKWQARIADTLEQFEVGGVDQTHDEMISRINEQTAKNEARMEIALESVDTQSMQIEVDAEKLRAGELVKQFKLEMGEKDTPSKDKPLLDEEGADEDKTRNEEISGEKTLGRQKSK